MKSKIVELSPAHFAFCILHFALCTSLFVPTCARAASLVYSLRGGLFEVYDDGTLKVSGGTGWFHGSGSPEGAVAAPVGSFYADTGGGGMYYKSSGAGNTGWTILSTGAGLTINPTTGYLPYRSGATTFGDSPWYYIKTNALGFNSTNWFIYVPNTTSLGLGDSSLSVITSGTGNTGFGQSAIASLTEGASVTAMGLNAGYSITVEGASTAIGANALSSAVDGSNNTAVGTAALQQLLSNSMNVAVGWAAGNALLGANNTALGAASLLNSTNSRLTAVGTYSGKTNITGVDLVFLGYDANPKTTGDTNSIAIGSYVVGQGSNTAQIGTNGVSVLYLNGTVGWYRGSGSPEGAVTAPVGSYYTREDGASGTTMYTKTSGTGNTGWEAMTVGAGLTINPTANRIPYRSSSTAFGDSPWHYVDTSRMGWGSTNITVYVDHSTLSMGYGKDVLSGAAFANGPSHIAALGASALNGASLDNADVIQAIGSSALLNASLKNTSYLLMLGSNTGESLVSTNVSFVIGIGADAFTSNAALQNGTADIIGIGERAFRSAVLTNTYDVIAMGYLAGYNLKATNSSELVALGTGALSGTSSLSMNSTADIIAIGQSSGKDATFSSTKDVILLGRNAGKSANLTSITNAMAFGYNTAPQASNTAQIGTNGTSVLYLNGTVGWYRGSGTPEGAVTANVGSFFSREDGGAGTSFYVKESGTGNTGWVGK